jgi:hypothetical protein
MKDEDFDSLRQKLNEGVSWPTVYFFKFIIPADNHKVAQVMALFGEDADITSRQSGQGNYIAISAKEVMLTPESVIEVYKKAAQVDGLIAL